VLRGGRQQPPGSTLVQDLRCSHADKAQHEAWHARPGIAGSTGLIQHLRLRHTAARMPVPADSSSTRRTRQHGSTQRVAALAAVHYPLAPFLGHLIPPPSSGGGISSSSSSSCCCCSAVVSRLVRNYAHAPGPPARPYRVSRRCRGRCGRRESLAQPSLEEACDQKVAKRPTTRRLPTLT
jgi:hypothetical protein